MKNFAYETAYFDLLGIIYLLEVKENSKYTQVPVYSLARDFCLIIYQINRDLLNDSVKLDKNIKSMRHKVKLFQKGKNKEIYQKIIDSSISQFGDDVDNIGFYLDNGLLAGSTFFPQYIFLDTDILGNKPRMNQQNSLKFFQYVGATSSYMFDEVNKVITDQSIKLEALPEFIYPDKLPYQTKDVHYSNLFIGEDQVALTRLLFIVQEATTCLWLKNGISTVRSELTLDNYITIRLLSIKADEVMDNLINMKRFLKESFNRIDDYCCGRLTGLIQYYEQTLLVECKQLRNFLHYNKSDENFYDFILTEIDKNNLYVNNLIDQIVLELMKPLVEVISSYFQVDKMESMTDWKKIRNRLKTLIRNGFKLN
ncbi:DNA polymerase III subunit gamma/tau [Aquibacillus saliphilus]|uniref:DNA polymerase III subunit gamma/tau n=1 Tax=Aquibacillus saliphilus TaxID=1909422 RepID=UPI001CEFF882|nr:DNA polymerase III subunit gamma/tau [Aquibacillus saliphilus]